MQWSVSADQRHTSATAGESEWYCAVQIRKQAFIDIRLRPGRTRNWLMTPNAAKPLPASRPLRPNVASSIKPEVHKVAVRGGPSHGHRGSAQKVLCGLVQWFLRYACGQTDRHTDRRVDHNTLHPERGGVTNRFQIKLVTEGINFPFYALHAISQTILPANRLVQIESSQPITWQNTI